MSISVQIRATSAVAPDEAFRRLADYRRYAELTETVRSVEIEHRGDQMFSTWSANFRGGVLRWTEEDQLDPVARRLTFEQVDGDLDVFTGCWEVHPDGSGSRMVFTAELDMGIPSLAPIVDPVAKDALESNMRSIVTGLFDDVRLDAAVGALVGGPS